MLLLLVFSTLANAAVVEYSFVDGAFRRVNHVDEPSTATNTQPDNHSQIIKDSFIGAICVEDGPTQKDVTDSKIGKKIIEIEDSFIDAIFQEDDAKAAKDIDNDNSTDTVHENNQDNSQYDGIVRSNNKTDVKVHANAQDINSDNPASSLSQDDATENVTDEADHTVLDNNQTGDMNNEGVKEESVLLDSLHAKGQENNNDTVLGVSLTNGSVNVDTKPSIDTNDDINSDGNETVPDKGQVNKNDTVPAINQTKDVKEDNNNREDRDGGPSISNILKTRWKLKSEVSGHSNRQYVTQRTTPIGQNAFSNRLYD